MNLRKLFLLLPLVALATGLRAQDATADTLDIEALFRNLPQVVVKAERPIVKLERGKLVYNMPNFLQTLPADNALDALSQLPGLTTTDEGKILLANTPVTLIINGRPTTLTQEQVQERLKAMPATQLAKAEVMQSAPAQYHVRGAAINIVTADYAGQHYTSGQLQASYLQSRYGRGTAQANLVHASGPLTLDFGYGYSLGKGYGEVERVAEHPLGNQRVHYADLNAGTHQGYIHNLRAEADYRLGEGHSLNLAYTGKLMSQDIHNTATGSSVSDTYGTSDTRMHNLDLAYTAPFGLRLYGSYTHHQTPETQSLDGTLQSTEVVERHLTASSNQRIDKWLVTADQEHTLSQGWGLNYGLMFQHTRNDSYQTTLDALGQPLPEASDSVDHAERIFNAYAGFSYQPSEQVSMSATLTAEHYNSPLWRSQWNLYPSANIFWAINARHQLNLALSTDATYPSYWSTMSQVFYTSPYSEIHGNPMLRPSRTYSPSLTWQFLRRYSLTAFASFEPNGFDQLPYQTSDRMAVIMKYVNFDTRQHYGLQATAQYSLGTWLTGNASVAGFVTRDRCDNFYDLSFDRSKLCARITANASILLSERAGLRLGLNPTCQSNAIQGVYDIRGFFSLNASLRWAARNGKWTVAAQGLNLTGHKFTTTSTIGHQNMRMIVNQNITSASLTATYKFGGHKDRQHRQVDTSRMR